MDTTTSMIHNISTSTLCLLLSLHLCIINNTRSNIANIHAHNKIITPSTTRTVETSLGSATIPSIILNTGINRCRTAVTTIIITVVVAITTITMIASNTIIIIMTSTRLLLLLSSAFV